MLPAPLNGNVIYFAYGANLSRAHMALWCPDAGALARAFLTGYRLVFRPWADIVPAPQDRVQGALYEVGPRDLVSLEEFKDFPALYHHVRVTVRTAEGPIEAMTFQMNPGHPIVFPDPDYLSLILQGYEDWGLDLGSLAVMDGMNNTMWASPNNR
jgi:gamma-glutamylcyclotransferase (GGCT)/AIG2-like uncharacterized protein YtfP